MRVPSPQERGCFLVLVSGRFSGKARKRTYKILQIGDIPFPRGREIEFTGKEHIGTRWFWGLCLTQPSVTDDLNNELFQILDNP